MSTGLLTKLIYAAKNIAFRLKEKQKMTIDDHVLEHMLFYHDLASSNLEDKKEIKIVKADINEAIARASSSQLSLALKLPPSLWKERLTNIVDGLGEDKQQVLVKLLLPKSKDIKGDQLDESLPVNSADWQVRANAAIILAYLKIQDAAPQLARSLEGDTANSIMSFSYIAYALAELQGPIARQALEKELINSDSWLRVDAAGALSYFDFSTVADSLAHALMQEQEALDYMSYAICRKIKPATFLRANSLDIVRGGCRLIFGIMQAAKNSFGNNLIVETHCHLCLPLLIERAQADPIILDTALALSKWLDGQGMMPEHEHKTILKEFVNDSALKERLLGIIKNASQNPKLTLNAELIHALRLAGLANIEETRPLLVLLLDELDKQANFVQLKYVISAISRLSNNQSQSSFVLISFAKKLVNFEERCQLNKSKQPVLEENVVEIKLYWQVLKALGNLSDENTVTFLEQALQDYAPDMRCRAIESLITIYKTREQIDTSNIVSAKNTIEHILQMGLKDPAPMVQLSALIGVSEMNQGSLIKDVVALINAQENTISKQSFNTLISMAKSDYGKEVKEELKDKITSIKEDHKRRQILDILQRF